MPQIGESEKWQSYEVKFPKEQELIVSPMANPSEELCSVKFRFEICTIFIVFYLWNSPDQDTSLFEW